MNNAMKCLCPLLALATSLRSQAVWVVDKFNNPGTHFTDLQPAVDAAAPGDVIHVRYNGSNSPDAYQAPTINGKALRIIGDLISGQLRPHVEGPWMIQNIPQGQNLVIARLGLFGSYAHGRGYVAAVSCPGAVVLDDLSGDPAMTWFPLPVFYGPFGVDGPRFVDCGHVAIQNCRFEGNGWMQSLRSTLMIVNSTLLAQHDGSEFGGPALVAAGSEITIMGSSLYGASAISAARWDHQAPAITYLGTDFWIGGGSRIEGGHDYYSGQSYTDMAFSDPWFGVYPGPTGVPLTSRVTIDWPATISGFNFTIDPSVTFVNAPLTAISQTQTATTLQVTQRCHPPSLTVLAIGDLAPSPWTNIVPRAFLDPATASIYFDPAPSASPLVRTFPIPPGLPPGLTVALQGFELPQSGAVSSSNVAFAGIW